MTESAVVEVPGGLDLAVGQALIFNVDDNTAVILGRDEGGYFARSAICTHACCIVTLCAGDVCESLAATPRACNSSGVVESQLAFCPCHGSLFQVSDGAALTGPAIKPLPAYKVSLGAVLRVDTGVLVPVAQRA